jgi:hypothetical protein
MRCGDIKSLGPQLEKPMNESQPPFPILTNAMPTKEERTTPGTTPGTEDFACPEMIPVVHRSLLYLESRIRMLITLTEIYIARSEI